MRDGKELTVLYEDSDAIAVVKPQGVVSEESDGACLPALLREFFAARGESTEIYPVHRLDKPTGGAILYAKTKVGATRLSLAVADRRVEKTYLAVVVGRPEADAGTLTDYLYHDKRQNKAFAVKKGRKGAKEAILDYRTLETAQYEGELLTLLNVTLRTGRTHQIRAQLASRKLPICGDRRYGSRLSLPDGRIALWSHELCFPRPSEGVERVASKPPCDLPWCLFAALNAEKENEVVKNSMDAL